MGIGRSKCWVCEGTGFVVCPTCGGAGTAVSPIQSPAAPALTNANAFVTAEKGDGGDGVPNSVPSGRFSLSNGEISAEAGNFVESFGDALVETAKQVASPEFQAEMLLCNAMGEPFTPKSASNEARVFAEKVARLADAVDNDTRERWPRSSFYESTPLGASPAPIFSSIA